MAGIVRTDAIVLRCIDYGETSRIVTLYTPLRGKVTVMARGARAAKSRFGSTLQPMCYIQAVYYHKPTREIQTLSEASHVRPFNDIGRSLEKMAVGLRIVEVASSLLEEEGSQESFDLLLRTIATLNEIDSHIQNLLPYFLMKLAVTLGFEPGFSRESIRALTDSGGVISLDSGEVFSADTLAPAGKRASREALRAFAICARAEMGPALALDHPPDVRRELDALIEAYFQYHVGNSFPVRSSTLYGHLLGDR